MRAIDRGKAWLVENLGPMPTARASGLRPEILFRDDLDGDVIAIDDQTWAIHGSIPVDREVIIAVFHREDEAEEVLSELLEVGKPGAPITGRSRRWR